MAGDLRRIAVVGGGIASMAAVYAITEEPDWAAKYEITVYQRGWRLGGKCASGRNRKHASRIEEHGLHIWAGFYDNAFRLIRSCYDELVARKLRSADAPLGTVEKALQPLDRCVLMEEAPEGSAEPFRPWLLEFPRNDLVPGSGTEVPTPFGYFKLALEFMVRQLEAVRASGLFTSEASGRSAHQSPVHHLLDRAKALPGDVLLHRLHQRSELIEIIEGLRDWIDGLEPATWIEEDTARRTYFMLDLGAAFARGMVVDRVFQRGFDAIDDMDCTAWLLKHGASEQAVNSAAFRSCYDYVFGYPGGITNNRGVGAGTAMRGLLRLVFTYRQALFFKMQAGMGDTIFGPYYQVLKARGVRFRFFHAVTKLALSPGKDAIERIDLVEQARPVNGEYEPLFDVKGLPCWPSEPLWEQLVDGAALEASGIDFETEKEPPTGSPKSLYRGREFDDVILGASIASLPGMTEELAAASPLWSTMLEKVETVATAAVQFWMGKPVSDFGWMELVKAHNPHTPFDPASLETVMTGFTEPLDTWADMSHLLEREGWSDPKPQSIAYFCSPSRDADVPAPSIEQQAEAWADRDLTAIWPGTRTKAGGFDKSLLVSIGGGSPDEKFAGQYFRQNVYGSERYVLSVPGSVCHRLSPDGSGFDNLLLAGDWTRCGINAGCVEAATISGLVAARALTGSTRPIPGEFDFGAEPLPSPTLLSQAAPHADWPLTPAFLRGAMDGIFAFHALPSPALQSMLPQGLKLTRQSVTPAGTHPVTFLFNRQSSVRPSFLPQLLGFAPYLENIVAINGVEIAGGDGTVFSYLPVLFLDNTLATASGRWFYGLAKRIALNSWTGNRRRTDTVDGNPVWEMRSIEHDPISRMADLEQMGLVRALLETPILTSRPLGLWQAMAFDFGLSSAFGSPVATHIDIFNGNDIGLPVGRLVSPPLSAGLQTNGLPGAFRLWTNWTLSNPFDSARVKRVAALQKDLNFGWCG